MKNKRLFILVLIILISALFLEAQEKKQKSTTNEREATSSAQAQENSKQKTSVPKKLIEEIVVYAPSPEVVSTAKTSTLTRDFIVKLHPRRLDEVINYLPGTFATEGTKNEASLKIRGLGPERVTLLYDGVPVYEPYFNSFDLKSFFTEEIQTIKVIKGANSVLYGPNTLGGVVNVITRRPTSPFLSLQAQYGGNNLFNYSLSGGGKYKRLAFFSSFNHDQADSYSYSNQGESIIRENSDYERTAFLGKVYFTPSAASELMASVSYLTSAYGIPWATDYYRPRYWRFKDWQRFQVNMGGIWEISEKTLLTGRSYYVSHHNVLDSYQTQSFLQRQWSSTYRNYSLGFFVVGQTELNSSHFLRFSLNLKKDEVNTQDDLGEPWEEHAHLTYSAGVEDTVRLAEWCSLVVGSSLDWLKEDNGEIKVALNPLAAFNFFPLRDLKFYLSLSQKSRFPSMKSLYSEVSGNPDLNEERGRNYEIGFHWKKGWEISGAIFYNRLTNLIRSVRTIYGFKTYDNIGRAWIKGLELEMARSVGPLILMANYTYLKTRNEETRLPLELIPGSSFNFMLSYELRNLMELNVWGRAVSRARSYLDSKILEIPAYWLANATLGINFSFGQVFLAIENMFNRYYFTEPGFPLRGRTLKVGARFKVEESVSK